MGRRGSAALRRPSGAVDGQAILPDLDLHAAGGEAVEGVAAVGLLGIDEGVDRRPFRSHLVVVGHDQPHAFRPTRSGL